MYKSIKLSKIPTSNEVRPVGNMVGGLTVPNYDKCKNNKIRFIEIISLLKKKKKKKMQHTNNGSQTISLQNMLITQIYSENTNIHKT